MILSILKGYIGNPNKSKKKALGNIILDSWSDSSYISSSMAEALDLNIHGYKNVTQSTLDNVSEKRVSTLKLVQELP